MKAMITTLFTLRMAGKQIGNTVFTVFILCFHAGGFA